MPLGRGVALSRCVINASGVTVAVSGNLRARFRRCVHGLIPVDRETPWSFRQNTHQGVSHILDQTADTATVITAAKYSAAQWNA